ncbi:D-alanyl-D-alanine carboxypeptidase/D-alanyl-D-alanine endopeptidase [Dietzia sp.]|uniref:D-alanyl-D-alanine carboxypeptidase/D-alanyl-D-alanine endopeptidase n=1 Tax=Dietzia sp. TaxID=1871616 RepID=UPI002FDB243F
MAAKVWRGRSILWRLGAVLVAMCVVIALIVAAALATKVETDDETDAAPMPTVPDPEPALEDLPADAPEPTPTALAAILDPLAAAPEVGELSGVVVDNATGEYLWQKDAKRARTPASTTKLLTALAVFSTVPSDHRISTTLAKGTEPGQLVLIPGGDVTTAQSTKSTFFPGTDTLDDFVALAKESGETFTSLTVAPGPYEGDDMAPGWNPEDIPGGFLTRVQPWMLDAARTDPAVDEAPREGQPMRAAANQFASRLGIDQSAVTVSDKPVAVGDEIGDVESGTLADRARNVLDVSDNVGADALCHEAAMEKTGIADADPISEGKAGYSDTAQRVSIREATDGVLATLREKGIDTTGTTLSDCSGMSSENKISADVLAQVLHVAAGPDASPQERAMLGGLPIAGGSGTLLDRFAAGTPAAAGAGWVRAKTGTLSGVTTLAGVVATKDGRSLSFALMSEGANPADSRPGVDAMAAALRGCGCR